MFPGSGRFLKRDEVADDAVIRTHLANERTFLAWLRSAVVLIGAGIAAAALTEGDRTIRTLAILIGGLAAFSGCVLIAWAYVDYNKNLDGINRGGFRPSSRLPLAATLITVVLALGAVTVAVLEWAKE